jgi:hypothetical protein
LWNGCSRELTRILEVLFVRPAMLEAPEPWEEDSGSEDLAQRMGTHRCRQTEVAMKALQCGGIPRRTEAFFNAVK